jgi:hypothetical protein
MKCAARRIGLHLLEFWENDSHGLGKLLMVTGCILIAPDPNTTYTSPFPRTLISV